CRGPRGARARERGAAPPPWAPAAPTPRPPARGCAQVVVARTEAVRNPGPPTEAARGRARAAAEPAVGAAAREAAGEQVEVRGAEGGRTARGARGVAPGLRRRPLPGRDPRSPAPPMQGRRPGPPRPPRATWSDRRGWCRRRATNGARRRAHR